VPALRNMLQSLSSEQTQAIVAAANAGQPFTLTVDGQPLEMGGDEILVESSSPAGLAVAEEGGYTVALNTEISEELRREGLARDLVRNVQDARKNAGLEISDHIRLFLQMPEALIEAVSPHRDALASETLADDVTFGTPPAEACTEESELGDEKIVIGIVKV